MLALRRRKHNRKSCTAHISVTQEQQQPVKLTTNSHSNPSNKGFNCATSCFNQAYNMTDNLCVRVCVYECNANR